jgi:hypothetical protein
VRQGSRPLEGGAWRGIRVALALSAAGIAASAALGAARPPPDHGAALLVLPVWGAALGLFARRQRPGGATRLAALAGLVAGATLLNLLWLPPLLASARGVPLERHREDLRERTLAHWHPLIASRALYLTLTPLLSGREVRWVPSPAIDPRRLMSLGDAARVVEIPPPGAWLPGPAYWQQHYETITFERDARARGGAHQRLVAVTDAADRAGYYVVLESDGTTLALPDAVWEAERRRAGRRSR